MRPAPIGVAGELYIGGVGVSSGYAANPSLTSERFVHDPAGPAGERLYRTGDLARLRDDGYVEFLGRADGQVKLRGMRIELGEIEAALREQPEVREAVVMPLEVSPGQVHLVGYVVSRDDGGAAPEKLVALRAALRRSLPEYMVPWALIPLTALPLTSNGKLDRAALPHPSVALADETSYEPPTSEAERTIAAIWQDVLGVPRVGLHQNFFDLGGHSLLMVRVHERLKAAFQLQLSMVEVFRYPTVAALAKFIAGAGENADAARENQVDRAQKQRLAMEKQAERNKARRTLKQ
jgi:acyl carrier protein